MRLNVNIPVDGNCARNFLYLLIDTNKNSHVLIQAVGVKEKEAYTYVYLEMETDFITDSPLCSRLTQHFRVVLETRKEKS
jgi:hypothetical protein